MFGHEEKVPVARLTAVQYVVLFMFLVLAYGLWRLQVMHSDEYSNWRSRTASAMCRFWRRAARFWIAKAASSSTTIPRFRRCCCAIPRAI